MENKIKNEPFILDEYVLDPLENKTIVSDFDCGDQDLNEYFQCDTVAHRIEMFTKSYSFHLKGDDIQNSLALIDFCNSEIRKESFKDVEMKNEIPEEKKGYSFFPAVKITRLGVAVNYQGKHVGSLLLDVVKAFFIAQSRAGCRFLLVDAYKEAVHFYEKNGFLPLYVKKPETRRTLPLFFDLKSILLD
jgi:ribosomal protein S18 acetylase RimI-like enzyme